MAIGFGNRKDFLRTRDSVWYTERLRRGSKTVNPRRPIRGDSGRVQEPLVPIPAKVIKKIGAFHIVKLYADGVDAPSTGTAEVYVLQLNFVETLPDNTWIIVQLSAIGAIGEGPVE